MELIGSLDALYPFLIALIIAGVVAGFLAGLFGVGGGAVLVPVFYQMLGELGIDESIRMHLAVGTSLAIIVPTSLMSFVKHKANGSVDMALLNAFKLFVPFGVICASIITVFISGAGLRVIFAVLSFAIAIKLLFGKEEWVLGKALPANPVKGIVGWAIGFFSTFMGIGGGTFNNLFMTLYGSSMHSAVATSSGVGVLIAIPGAIGYIIAGWGNALLPVYSFGYVNFLMVIMVIPLTLLFAPLGVKVAHLVSKRQLEASFGVFLILVSIRFFVSLF
ncbi:MAG: sulfite exporter TauE/SafE family protein [Nitratireductor sp.]